MANFDENAEDLRNEEELDSTEVGPGDDVDGDEEETEEEEADEEVA